MKKCERAARRHGVGATRSPGFRSTHLTKRVSSLWIRPRQGLLDPKISHLHTLLAAGHAARVA
jgi:hypothetical protein